MIKSIQQFQSTGVEKLEKIFVDYAGDMKKIAEMVAGVKDSVISLGLSMIAEEWEQYDEVLRERKDLRSQWYVVRRDETTLLTSLGAVTYHKTLFKNKTTGKSEYLLDRLMGIEKHTRMTEDAVAQILEEAVDSSYRKGGEHASITADIVSKETVMNKLHTLNFPEIQAQQEKRSLKYLYIDADEDHVSLQYLDKKGDIRKPRTNTIMPKIVYVYEGIDTENKRHELINKKHFGGVYEGGKEIEKLWSEVWEYIEASYDTESLVKIYINGDGASWIKGGAKLLHKARFVLDRFHMHKYIIGATSHLEDSVEDARSDIYRAIYQQKKWKAEEAFDRILAVTESTGKIKTVTEAKRYILENWSGIMQKVRDKNEEVKCSAEGHVSHVYSARMSSRPLGWSRIGADKMARLCIYKANHGNMLELVRYQKQDLPKAVGCEEIIYSCEQIMAMERKTKKRIGKRVDVPTYRIPYPQIQKIAALKNQIYGL